MRVINEHSGMEVEASFYSNPGVPAIPSTVHWKALCVTTGTVLQDWTEATPVIVTDGSLLSHVSVTVDVPGILNVIQDSTNPRELKRVLICADKDTHSEFTKERDYYVKKVGR